MLITVLIAVTATLLIVSKFFDCYTTIKMSRRYNDKISMEKNPIAKLFMKVFGFRTVIWGIFTIIIILVSFLVYNVYTQDDTCFTAGFIIIGFIISLAQFDVAKSNYYGSRSFFTRFLEKAYMRFS